MIEPPMIIINSQPQDSLPATDRGLAYGDGVFETMKVVNGDIALWQYHYARLLDGLQRLHIDINHQAFLQHIHASIESVRQQQQETQPQKSQKQGVLKLIVTRGDGQRGYMPAQDASATFVSIYTPLPDTFLNDNELHQQAGVTVHICQERLAVSSSLAGIKSLNQLSYVLASRERQSLVAQEGLLLDKNDYIIEATARNIFLVKDDVLYTPLVDECGVAGVMRRLIIDLAATQVGVTVKEARITLPMLGDADEVFLSNGVSGIWPVVGCVDGCTFEHIADDADKQWPVGNVSQKVQQYCNHFQADETQSLSAFLSSSHFFSSN
jgi:4-amino-4-deoxychorismate lyase